MRTRLTILVSLSIMWMASTASARPGFFSRLVNWRNRSQQVRARVSSTAQTNTVPRMATTFRNPGTEAHGTRAYNTAKRFAEQHNLKHFSVNKGGVQRIVVNVPSGKIKEWTKTFSDGKCFIEPFFNASNKSSPNWSMLRMGPKNWQQYGKGDTYRANTYSGRVAFPISLSESEMGTTVDKIKNSPNGPWSYGGGNPETSGRNCTNWVTYKIGQFTGVKTGSVKHHMRSLVTGSHSDRATVMAVMTENPVRNFGQDQLNIKWH